MRLWYKNNFLLQIYGQNYTLKIIVYAGVTSGVTSGVTIGATIHTTGHYCSQPNALPVKCTSARSFQISKRTTTASTTAAATKADLDVERAWARAQRIGLKGLNSKARY